jgi:trimethylamine--corrinoid protein Co-methyltransferase
MIGLSVLDEEMINQIHDATLEVLSTTGIAILHPHAKTLLKEHGAGQDGERITIPEGLIEKCISLIPPLVILQGRDPAKSIDLCTGVFHAHNVGGVPNVFDPTTGSRRSATREDNIQASRLLDKLPNVASITPLFTPQDVPGKVMSLWMIFDTLANSTKPFRAPGMQTGAEIRALKELVNIACPDGTVTVGVSPVSPLTFPDGITDAILEASRNGFVLGPLPCPILGATAPMTMSGGLVQQNAEVLASIVLAQLAQPGTPIIYKGRLSVMNPRSGLSVWGNPEIGMISSATVAMAHSYGIPVDVYGFCTNAHHLDIQNGYERALNAIMPVLAGADEISGVGEMEGGVSSSFVQLVIDDEIINSLKRLQDGIQVNHERLGSNIIHKIMEGPRNFLSEKHTLKYLRKGEVLNPQLAVRDSWSQWEKNDRKSIIDKAEDRMKSFFEECDIEPLTEIQKKEMKRVIQAYQ